MTGFVDPAFKRLNVTEPNFIVWRISKLPEENYDVKLVKKELWGCFFEEDSYIVFSSSPVKKPPGIIDGKKKSKMEINIHFWLGSKLSEDDRRRTILKAIEVDDVLEGAAVLHREIQSSESNRFLSYFKAGLVTMRGEITAVLRQAQMYSRTKLFELSERASTLLLTEFPTISWTFVSVESVVVLEAKDKIFLWLGQEANSEKKSTALKFESRREHYGSDKKLIWVKDGEEQKLPKEDLYDFEQFLSLRCKSVSLPADDDLVLIHTNSRKNTQLYKVITEENGNTIIYMKDGPLLQSDLASMQICLIHHYTNCIWVWVSRKVSKEERGRAINIGIAYLDKKPVTLTKYLTMSKMTVKRVVEGLEPAEFKLLFRSWSDNFPADENSYFRKTLARPVNVQLTSDKLDESPCLAVQTQLFDCGTGKMKILRVNGTNLEPLQPEQFGIFHASFSYLVYYSYTLRGKTENILYYWLGRNVAAQEKENIIWSSLKDIPDLDDAAVLIRVEQDHETPHFHAIFQGKILILTHSRIAWSNKKWNLDDHPIILLKIKGGDMLNNLSTEVEPHASSLNSFNVFLLRTPKLSYVWCGRSSKGDERAIAKVVARKWTTEYCVILEGDENEEFWNLLGGFKCYSSEEEKQETEINVPPRAFKCSWFHGHIEATEIINFAQSDFGPLDVIILDTWRTIFVWTGRHVSKEENFESEKLVIAYLNSDPCGRKLEIPIIHVRQDREPAIFRGYFPSWNTSSTFHNDDSFVKKLLSQIKEDKSIKEEKIASGDVKSPPETMETEPEKTSFPSDMLQQKSAEEISKDVDPQRMEEYLSDEDFFNVFRMSRDLFMKLPQWKRKHLKKSIGLF